MCGVAMVFSGLQNSLFGLDNILNTYANLMGLDNILDIVHVDLHCCQLYRCLPTLCISQSIPLGIQRFRWHIA